MSTKHIFDSSDGLVLKSLRGAVALNPGLRLYAPSKCVFTSPESPDLHVAVISGGGAGHEPAHAGYTGKGMLAGSVSGDIFASPSSSQILTLIQLVSKHEKPGHNSSNMGVLAVINNYTGDRLNFGLAIERARTLGIQVDSVVVGDDVSLKDSEHASLVGPRGLAGNILVCKLLGAFVARGESLARTKALGDAVVQNLASVGMSLDHCHVPGRASTKENKGVGEEECEIGMGLHNEPGARRVRVTSAGEIVRDMIGLVLTSTPDHEKDEGKEKGVSEEFVRFGKTGVDEVVLFVNNLGGLSQLEMGAVLDEIVTQLGATNIHPIRIYLSSYMTSLNSPGFSLSILNVSRVRRTLALSSIITEDIDIPTLLDAPTDALAWIGVRTHWPARGTMRDRVHEEEEIERRVRAFAPAAETIEEINRSAEGGSLTVPGIPPEAVEAGIREACQRVLSVEHEMSQFDTIAGDGDCGETFAAGAKAVLAALDSRKINVRQMSNAALATKLGTILEESMGGTIGALFALFFTSLSTALSAQEAPLSSQKSSNSPSSWQAAPIAALSSLSAYTPARPGDRTVIDALHPFAAALSAQEGLEDAVRKAREGAEGTRGMQPRLGRATYVAGRNKTSEEGMPPDPGAWGVAAILEGFMKGLHGL